MSNNKQVNEQNVNEQDIKESDVKDYDVKVGEEFEIEEFKVEPQHPTPFHDWKVVLVLAVFILLFSSWAHAAYTGDTYLFDRALDALVESLDALMESMSVFHKGN